MKRWRSRAKKAGQLPGALVHLGEQKVENATIMAVDYNADGYYAEHEITSVDQLTYARESHTVTWVNVDGLHEVNVIEAVGGFFGIHPLLLEDILNTDQRPKIEQYDNYIYLILKILHEGEDGRIKTEQVSIVLGQNFVLTFQEQKQDDFIPLRQRLKNSKGRLLQKGADYLAYFLLDTIIDNYFLILENLGEQIELLEDDLISNPTTEIFEKIHALKREMLFLRRSIWPLREVIGGLQHGDTALIYESTQIYLRDVYEHTIQIIDTLETYRDIVSGLLDIYLSSLSNRMNEVMKVLTVISTIFMPLTFITGLYGMNFAYMPELQWRWGYFGVWGLILATTALLVIYFRRKKWL